MSDEDGCKEMRTRFIRSFLDVTILYILSDEPSWGYRIMTDLKERFDVKVGPSVIYPLLDSMTEKGFVEVNDVYSGKRKRRTYSIIPKGLESIKCMRSVIAGLFEVDG